MKHQSILNNHKLAEKYWAWIEMSLFCENEPEIILLKLVIVMPVVFVLFAVLEPRFKCPSQAYTVHLPKHVPCFEMEITDA